MQFTFRIDDDNYLTFTLNLSPASSGSPSDGPDLHSAAVTDSKLSKLEDHQLLDLAAQIIDYCSHSDSSGEPDSDWFTNQWLPATKTKRPN